MLSIGVAQWSLDRFGVATVGRAAELGFDSMHLDVRSLEEDNCLLVPEWRRRFSAAASEAAIQLTALATNAIEDIGPLSDPQSAPARRCRDIIHGAIDAAVEMCVPVVYVPSFHLAEIRTGADLDRTADLLHDACCFAEKTTILIATENTLNAVGNSELVSRVGHPRLRVLVDTYNTFLWGHDVCDLIGAVRTSMCDQVHVKDGRDGIMGNAPLGGGEGNFAEASRCLLDSGFNGTIVCENDYRVDAEDRARRDIRAIRRLFARDVPYGTKIATGDCL